MISNVVSEVRKGISGARLANQIDQNSGMMADLPEFIEFEVQVIGNYRTQEGNIISGRQILSRVTDDLDIGLDRKNEVAVETGQDTNNELSVDVGQDTSNEVAVDTAGGVVASQKDESTENLETLTGNKGSLKSETARSGLDVDRDSDTSDTTDSTQDVEVKKDQNRDARQVGTGRQERAGTGAGTRNQRRNITQQRARGQSTGGTHARGYGFLETETGVFIGQGQAFQPFRPGAQAGDPTCD